MNKLLAFVVVVECLVNTLIYARVDIDPFSDEFIEIINRDQSLWVAGRNFDKETSMKYMNSLSKFLPPTPRYEIPIMRHNVNIEIPKSFDWRNYYPSCTTLRSIRDQGACASCWAVASAEVMSDRICMHSEGKKNVYISEYDLMACCKNCWANGSITCSNSGGGYTPKSFEYWQKMGIVSGGPYNSMQGCRPYKIPPAGFKYTERLMPRPYSNCDRKCRPGYSSTYHADLYFGQSFYGISEDPEQIQIEIILNGPVTAWLEVYEDFFNYRKGVYRHKYGERNGSHFVKILGWGNEDGAPYWLAANSWSTAFGLNGYFKILRGENHCSIEKQIIAGIPERRYL